MALLLFRLGPRREAPPPRRAEETVVVAAGDIACAPDARPRARGAQACQHGATAELARRLDPDAVLAVGDIQYEDGSLSNFRASFDKTWGQLLDKLRPTPGNHEYRTQGAAGYFAYFAERAGDPSRGYYSFGLGSWQLISLNGNCIRVGGCGAGSSQEQWLREVLRTSAARCTLAYWHQARFSSGNHGNDARYDALWRALYETGAEVIINAHDHSYERFAPQDPDARPDPERG
ncbi:MAG: metallophosphoesterase family protein, partial [Acidimicrobiales bacterium]